MKSGEIITAQTFDGKVIACRLVEVRDETAIFCSNEEWQKAKAERREPQCLGWPLSSVQSKRASPSPAMPSEAAG